MKNTSIQASLELLGDKFDTNYVTTLLNKKPDYILTKGDLIKSTKQKSDVTVWGIRIKEAESVDLDTHLNPIFGFIEQNLDIIKLLNEKIDAEWIINAYITIRNERTPGMVLTPRQIELANAIKATIGFDLYAHQYTLEQTSFDQCPLCGNQLNTREGTGQGTIFPPDSA